LRKRYEGQKFGQSQRLDYTGKIGRTNTLLSQVVPYNAKVVQSFQEKLRAKYMAELPEICQFSAYTAFNLPAWPATHCESGIHVNVLSLPGLLPLVHLIDFQGLSSLIASINI
jgi:hypothetical protein